jgi:biotin-(acetyl-CoA carboxylase) ligase
LEFWICFGFRNSDFEFAFLFMLMSSDDRLDPDLIRANLRTRQIGRKILVYEQTLSTNDVAAEYARNPENAGLAVFAEEQTAGRGRGGAQWHSARGDGLLFSVILPECNVSHELLSLTCAVAVAEGIGQVGGCQAGIKWPNDIVLEGRKVAGILLESRVRRTEDRKQRAEDGGQRTEDGGQSHSGRVCTAHQHPTDKSRSGRVCSAHQDLPEEKEDGVRSTPYPPPAAYRPPSSGIYIVGIGINCHQTLAGFPPELRATATSLDLVSGARCQRVTVAKRVLTSLDHWLRVAGRSRRQVIETWSHLSTQLGQRVTLSFNRRRFTGNCIGVDPEKGLILQLDRGGIRMFDAAHTHIVK